MELRSLIWKLLKEQVDQNTINLKNKYVGIGKPLSEEDFDKIIEVTGNKFYLMSWITKKVGQGFIKAEDIYKYKEYFDIFEKNKRKFQHNDIHLYKTDQDVKNFLKEVIKIREGGIVYDETQGKENFVTQKDIEKLESTGGIKYLGIFDNGDYKYQVFQVFKVGENIWKLYRDILGRCRAREKGAKIDICTIGQYKYFKRYLSEYEGSNYFVLYNLDDFRSPYQLHYESGQFMDKNDWEYHDIDKLKFFEFVGGKVPKYDMEGENFPGLFEIPVKGQGFLDDQKRKQGLWKFVNQGKLMNLITYKDDKENGPFEHYQFNGKLLKKGSEKFIDRGKSIYVGPYEEYLENGRLLSKGVYKADGSKKGIWYQATAWNFNYYMMDFSSSPTTLSAFTKSNVLKYVSFIKESNFRKPFGKTIAYYPSGKVKAEGTLSVKSNPIGKWTWYTSDGKIKSQGRYVDGERYYNWVDRVKTKDGQTLIFTADFIKGKVGKVKVFNTKGELIEKVSPKKIKPFPYWDSNLDFLKP